MNEQARYKRIAIEEERLSQHDDVPPTHTVLTNYSYCIYLATLTTILFNCFFERCFFVMGDFREHGVMMYLDKTLYKAFIRLQADKGLGRSYAGLLPFTEGLHKLGYLSQEDYEVHAKKYSQGLLEEPNPEASKPETMTDVREKTRIEELSRAFSGAVSQWENMKPKSRAYYIEKAKENPTIPNAKLILNYASGGT